MSYEIIDAHRKMLNTQSTLLKALKWCVANVGESAGEVEVVRVEKRGKVEKRQVETTYRYDPD